MATTMHSPCCSSHGASMDCATYRRTHFVEVGACCDTWAAAHPDAVVWVGARPDSSRADLPATTPRSTT